MNIKKIAILGLTAGVLLTGSNKVKKGENIGSLKKETYKKVEKITNTDKINNLKLKLKKIKKDFEDKVIEYEEYMRLEKRILTEIDKLSNNKTK